MRHQCMIYTGSPAAHLSGLAALIAAKLGSNVRCLYLNSPPMIAGIRSYLAATGMDVAREVDRGALVLSSSDGHLIDGRFDVERMLALLSDSVCQASNDGYDGLWASGDMTWEFGLERNFDKLHDYERGLETLFERHPSLHGICQYHVDTLPPEAVEVALHTHRSAYLNETLCRINSCYVSPNSKMRPQIPAALMSSMLAGPKGEFEA